MSAKAVRGESGTDQVPNHEIVTAAVFLLGGAIAPVDTEDVAVKANQLAPGRFAWKRYPEQINIEAVRKRLWDARRLARVNGSDRTGWTLTEGGVRLAKSLATRLKGVPSKHRLTLKERRWRAAERRRLLASEAFQRWRDEGASAVGIQEAEAFFRLDEYVPHEMRERKISRVLDAFSDHPVLGRSVIQIARIVRRGKHE
jgi:hypothetical protein